MNDSMREPPISPELEAQRRLHDRQRKLEGERRGSPAPPELIRAPGYKRGFKPLPNTPPAATDAPKHLVNPGMRKTPPNAPAEQVGQLVSQQAPAAQPLRPLEKTNDIQTLTERVPPSKPPAAPPGSTVKRRLLRTLLLIVVPILVLLAGIWFYVHGGRYVTSENAYVKANIVAISADVPGRVTNVLVTDNQFVDAGTLLFELDTTPYEIDIAQAEADMAVVRTDIEALRADYRETLVSIEEAQEQKNFRDSELNRQQTMLNRGIGTAKELDLARHDAVMAKRRLNTQQARARQALANLNGRELIQAEEHPRFQRAMTSRQHAANAIEKTKILAPTSGIISNMKLQAGEYVEDGKPVFSLIETDPLWVEANLKETQLTHLFVGQRATFVADAYPNITWSATVDTIAPATGAEFSLLPPQNATGNWVKVVQRVPVRLGISNPQIELEQTEPVLRAGMTVTVSIDTEVERELPTIVANVIDATPMPVFLRQWLTPSS